MTSLILQGVRMSRAMHESGSRNGYSSFDDADGHGDRGELSHAALVVFEAVQAAMERDRRVRDAVQTLAGWLSSGELKGRASDGMRAERTDIDLDLVATRCLLKAEACRWLIERRRRVIETDESEESLRGADIELVNRARELRGCWLWMLQPGEGAHTDALLENLSDTYTALAEALTLASALGLEDGGEGLDEQGVSQMYHLLAEAQSSLWAGLQVAGVQRDQDQIDAFVWLRERTREQRVYIERHMRREDPADPSNAADLLRRVRDLAGALGRPAEA
jgi:hypothetical protein